MRALIGLLTKDVLIKQSKQLFFRGCNLSTMKGNFNCRKSIIFYRGKDLQDWEKELQSIIEHAEKTHHQSNERKTEDPRFSFFPEAIQMRWDFVHAIVRIWHLYT